MVKKFVVSSTRASCAKGWSRFPLPVEITPFCHEHTARTIAELPT